jgi:drug/metabolite transporter (DMT)-like permease
VLAVLFGVLAGASFGAMIVAVRVGLGSGVRPEVGAATAAIVAFAVSVLLALASREDIHPNELWAFAATGLLVPGASQIVFVLAIRDAGPSRAAIVIGTAPLLSVLIALVFLDEPFHPVLLAGTVLIVAGGAALARERVRPHDFKAMGIALAFVCATLFAVRDNAVRWLARDENAPPLAAASTSLLAAAAFLFVYLVVRQPAALGDRLQAAIRPFLPAGIALAGGYVFLLEAFSHGRVSIVAPLNATQSLWAVAFAVVALRRHEAIGPRLVAASALIVVGSAVIGVVR